MFVLLLSLLFAAAWNHFVIWLLFAVTRWYLLLLFVYTYCLLLFAAWSFALCSCFCCLLMYGVLFDMICWYWLQIATMYLLPFPTMCCQLQLFAAFCNNFMIFAAFCFAATWCYLLLFAALFCCCCCC